MTTLAEATAVRESWVKKNTKTKVYVERGETYRITVTYGLHQLKGNRYPYFSITGKIDRKNRYGSWGEDSCGMIHEDIAQHFPELEPILKWHLVDATGEPMHYMANGRYWYDQIGKPKRNSYAPDAEQAFKSTVVFGAVEGDEMPSGDVDVWMANRKERLAEVFMQAMHEYGCYNEV